MWQSSNLTNNILIENSNLESRGGVDCVSFEEREEKPLNDSIEHFRFMGELNFVLIWND